MSRRRPARTKHRHLERTAEVAEQVQKETAPIGRWPCPGVCNAVRRKRLAEAHGHALDHLAAATGKSKKEIVGLARAGKLGKQELEHDAAQRRGQSRTAAAALEAFTQVRVPEARPGRPVWCLRCRAEVMTALERLPRLIAWTAAIGAPEPAVRNLDPFAPGVLPRRRAFRRSPVTEPVAVVDVAPGAPGLAVEVLACGHRHTRPLGPAPASRVCRTCVAAAMVPTPGRLAPPPKRAQGSPSTLGVAPVSPAGSPAWVELDAAVQWACDSARQARLLLGHTDRAYDRWRSGSSVFRFREAVAALRYLHDYRKQLLASDLGKPLGVEALALATRLLRVSGRTLLVHHLDAPCPKCGRMGLRRDDGADTVRCEFCYDRWPEASYRRLTLVLASDPEVTGERRTGG